MDRGKVREKEETVERGGDIRKKKKGDNVRRGKGKKLEEMRKRKVQRRGKMVVKCQKEILNTDYNVKCPTTPTEKKHTEHSS